MPCPAPSACCRTGDGVHVPPEPVFETIANELRRARQERTLGRVATRINRVQGGLRSVITRTARRVREAEGPSWRDTLVGIHAAWDDVQTWHAIRYAGERFTARHYLHALDLERRSDGHIAQRPDEYRVYLPLLWRTLVVSLSLTGLCLLLGYPIAYLIAHAPPQRANLLLLLVLVPFWTSLLVRTTAWIVLLQTQGVINSTLVALGLIADNSRLAMIYNMTGTMVAMTHVLLPFMVLPLYAVMRTIPRLHMSAAASLGASALPGILAGLLAPDPARCWRRLAAGLHPGNRLLHHARPGRRSERPAHLQYDRLPYADFPELGTGRGNRRSAAGLRPGAVSGVRPPGGHRTHEVGLR